MNPGLGDYFIGICLLCAATMLFVFRKKSYLPSPKEEFDRMNHEYQLNGCFIDENGILQHNVDALIYRWEEINGKVEQPEPLLQQGNYDGTGY